MGVKQLWELLAPTGVRVEVDALAGKRVAVDASIWLVQFIKAMRDDSTGEVIKNAHLLGFFRRIVKLLCIRVRPVFVFDGATPALKRQTVQARRAQRKHADTRLKAVAEKLLIQRMREHAALQKGGAAPSAAPSDAAEALPVEPAVAPPAYDEALDAATAAALAEEEDEALDDDEDDEDFGFELPALGEGEMIDMVALAALPQSMQLEFMQRYRVQQVAANRERFAKASETAPAAFSAAQMEAYIAGGRVKRQLNALVRQGDQPDAMRAQRIAGDTTQEFVFDKRAGRDSGLPMPARPPLAPLRAPAAEPRFAFTTLHRVLPPPMAGTVAAQPVAPPPPLPDAPPPFADAIDVDAADDVEDATIPAAPAVQIEFELPDRVDGDDEELDEWEDVAPAAIVDDTPAPIAVEEATNLLAAAMAQAEEVARLSPPPEAVVIEEAAVPIARSAFYKRSHGFMNGRSLDAWDGGAGGAGAPPPAADAEEQRELEMAIQRSLSDAAAPKKARAAAQSRVVISLLDDDDAPRPAPPADMAAHRRPPSPLKLWEPSPPVVLLDDEEDGGGAGAGDDDADLRAAIAASLGQAPEAPPAAPELTVTSQGVTWRLTLAEFAGLAGNLSHHWPPWLPSPLDLEDKPVKVRCAGRAWDVDTPMEESLLGIVDKARRAARGEAAPPPARKASKAASMLPPPPPRTMAMPAPLPVPDGPAWEARWENVSSVWHASAVAPVARVSAASPGARAATAEEEAELSARDAEAAAEAEAAQAAEFARERAALQAERASAARGADTVTPEMYVEVQRMLTSFGIPFIIAPAEAEAQCAWLDANGLVDGVVTDDSDVFLFGARTVYRNLFDAKKYVEVYTSADVQRSLGLDRDRLALLALLLGSDYTTGVQGVGPVNAAEIISAFPTMDALRRFKAWVDAPESDRVADEAARLAGGRRGARAKVASPDKPVAAAEAADGDAAAASPAAGAATAASLDVGADGGTEAEEEYKRAHRGRRKAWSLSESFPSQLVVDAYTHPSVDKSRARFEWGRPNTAELRHLCRDTLGLLQPDLEKVLDRIVTEHDTAETQRTMNSFFMPQQAEQQFAKMRSKRLLKAVGGLTGREVDPELVLGDLEAAPAAKKPRKPRAPKAAKPKPKKPKKKKSMLASSDEEESSGGASDDEYAPKEPRATRGKAAAAAAAPAPAAAAAGAAPDAVIVLDDDDNEEDE